MNKFSNSNDLFYFLESEITSEGDDVEVEDDPETETDIKSKAILKRLVLKYSRRISKYKPGLELNISYGDQKEYVYQLTKRVGLWPEYPKFVPELTPLQILNFGVLQGKIINDCFHEFPREWFLELLDKNKLSILKPMRKFNYYNVPEDPLALNWRDEDHDSLMDQLDPRGWLQWYCRFYLGRRTNIDRKQINRWISFNKRYKNMIEHSCKLKDDRCKPKIKQAMICWAINPEKL